ncbi:MAG: hypothetical protein LWW86_02330 [Micrococcales bacterium]|nr:hypothetical protein [Micrococcales bacterium]
MSEPRPYAYPPQRRLDPSGHATASAETATPDEARRLLAEADRLDRQAAAEAMPWSRAPRLAAAVAVVAGVMLMMLAPLLPQISLDDTTGSFLPVLLLMFPLRWCVDSGPRVAVPGRARPLTLLTLAVTLVFALSVASQALWGLHLSARDGWPLLAALPAIVISLVAGVGGTSRRLRESPLLPMLSHWGPGVWWGWAAALVIVGALRFGGVADGLPGSAGTLAAALAALAILVPAVLQGRGRG